MGFVREYSFLFFGPVEIQRHSADQGPYASSRNSLSIRFTQLSCYRVDDVEFMIGDITKSIKRRARFFSCDSRPYRTDSSGKDNSGQISSWISLLHLL